MAPHSSTLAWKIPWTEEPGGLQSMGSLRVGHDSATSLSLSTFMHWERQWHPTPVFLPGESQGRGSLVGCSPWGHTDPIALRTIPLVTLCANKDSWPWLSASACMHSHSVMSNSVRPHRQQPTRLPHPWDSPGKNIGVGCHFLLQCMKVKSESEVAQSCPTLSDPMDYSFPGSSIHGIFQARVLEWGAIAFSDQLTKYM